jgi:hypothetical protein
MSKSDEDDVDACDSGEELETTKLLRPTNKHPPQPDTSTSQPDTSHQNFIMSLDFQEPAIAIGSYCRVDPTTLLRHNPSQVRAGAKSTKRRRKPEEHLNSTTASIQSSSTISKNNKRSLSSKR